ncbi:hypothetical protein EsH8_VII_000052 [Colletotrichum jinshuiense]
MITEQQATGTNSDPPFDVAVIGAGIIGLQVAIGLASRDVPVTVYEQAFELKEIGAGLGLPSHVVECMNVIDSRIPKSFLTIATKSKDMVYIDGFSHDDIGQRPKERLFDMELLKRDGCDIFTCHRAQFLSELVSLCPSEQIKLGKRLVSISPGAEKRYLIRFSDDTSAEADAVIGCDGVKSRVRQIVVGEDNPAAFAHYANESVYRGLLDMKQAAAALGAASETPIVYLGQGANIVTYPVAGDRYLNFAGFVRDSAGWHNSNKLTAPGSKKDVLKAFSEFGPSVKTLIELLPDELNRWALFDTFDHPVSTYAYDGIVLAGDAAHASTPHFGIGAGMGVEDALVLVTLLERAGEEVTTKHGEISKHSALAAAFKSYDSVRRGRSRWVVENSRRQGEVFKWLNHEVGRDHERFIKDTQDRMDKIVLYEWRGMILQAKREFDRYLYA